MEAHGNRHAGEMLFGVLVHAAFGAHPQVAQVQVCRDLLGQTVENEVPGRVEAGALVADGI